MWRGSIRTKSVNQPLLFSLRLPRCVSLRSGLITLHVAVQCLQHSNRSMHQGAAVSRRP